MKNYLSIFLWSSLAGGLVLTSLSYLGYQPWDMEYAFALLCSLLVGAFCHIASRYPMVGIPLMLLLSALMPAVYFGNEIILDTGLMAGVAMLLVGLAWIAAIQFRHALLICGIATFSQIISGIATTPSFTKYHTTALVERPDRPSVIHVLLDEHAGIAALPDTLNPSDIKNLTDIYVRNGFVVFTHAYTKEAETPHTVNRMFNVREETSPSIDYVRQSVGNNQWILSKASTFDEIAHKRAIDITSIKYVNVSGALKYNPAVANLHIYNENTVHGVFAHYQLPFIERITIAFYKVLLWNYWVVSSKLVGTIYEALQLEDLPNKQNIISRTHPITSRYVLQQFKQRLVHEGKRGSYYYLHIILPHYSYIFDSACHVKPSSQWYGVTVSPNPYHSKYEAHLQQATCAAHDISNLASAVSQSKPLHDATLFIHSDHGARIYGHKPEERKKELQGSFIAVRIPGIAGQLVHPPVRLDLLYKQLLDKDFRSLNLKKLPKSNDSIY